jgi:hypothetical protein
MSDEPQVDTSTVGEGVFFGLVLQLIQVPFVMFIVGWAIIGVSQLLYIVPAIVIATRSGKFNRRKGLIIAACIVALLNATCWGALGFGNFRIGG